MTNGATPPTSALQKKLSFNLAAITPPSGHIVGSNDTLFIRAWNSAPGVTLTVRGHQLAEDNEVHEFVFSLTPTTARALNIQTQPLANGLLLDCAVFADAGAPLRGQCFVQVGIIGTGDLVNAPSAVLLSDYVQDGCGLGWPGAPLRSTLDGPGVMRHIIGTDPAAGAEISETVPTNARWKFHSLVASLVTSATVATRFASLAFDDGAAVYSRWVNNNGQAASLTRLWVYGNTGPPTTLAGTALLLVPVPTMSLMAGHRLRTITEGFQAADDWGAPSYLVEEWIEP